MANYVERSSDSRFQYQKEKILELSNGRYTLIKFQTVETMATFYDNVEQKEFEDIPHNLTRRLKPSKKLVIKPYPKNVLEQIEELINAKNYSIIRKIKTMLESCDTETSFIEEIQSYCEENRFTIKDEFINCDIPCYFSDNLRNNIFYTTPKKLLSSLKKYHKEYGDCSDFYFGFENKNSVGARNIEKYLIKNNLYFIREYSFKNLKSKKVLRFDFAVFKNKNDLMENNNPILIEFDGIQHEKPIEYFGGINSFQENQKRDSMKNNYVLENNLKLIRLTESSFKDIENILDEELRDEE